MVLEEYFQRIYKRQEYISLKYDYLYFTVTNNKTNKKYVMVLNNNAVSEIFK